MHELVKIPFGSHMYGTADAQSDLDFKVLYLPNIDDLLLCKKVGNIKVKPGNEQESMKPGDVETEYVPLQTFMRDVFSGQSYAVEMLFALKNGAAELIDSETGHKFAHLLPDIVNNLSTQFLTADMTKMVGYAINQSRVYGLKTQRYSTALKVYTVICSAAIESGAEKRLREVPKLIETLLSFDRVHMTEILNGNGGAELSEAIDIVGKKYPLTITLKTLLISVRKSLDSFGDRVKKFSDEGTDWKALSHAIRVVEQVLELKTTKVLTLPRPNAGYLLDVKRGRVSLDSATEYLTMKFNEYEVLSESALPESTDELAVEFDKYMLSVLLAMYKSAL